MNLSENLIEHLANLARLDLTKEEKKKYLKDISSILSYVEKIQKITLADGGSLINGDAGNVWRQDVMEENKKTEKQIIIQSFPEKEGELLKVKGVFE